MVRYYIGMTRRFSWKVMLLGAIGIVGLQATALYIFGQPFTCACGEIKLWEGVVASSGNSQQFTDWYTFSHVIHGIIFFGFFSLFFPRIPLAYRFLLALGLEVGWEILENTPWVINHYREQALAAGYTGDSILNSVCDSLSMMLGFVMARRLPLWVSVSFVLGAELFVGAMIRDNLTLNVLNLLYQFDFIHSWQSRG